MSSNDNKTECSTEVTVDLTSDDDEGINICSASLEEENIFQVQTAHFIEGVHKPDVILVLKIYRSVTCFNTLQTYFLKYLSFIK